MTSPSSGAEASPASAGTGAESVIAGVFCGFLAIVQSVGFGTLLLTGASQSLSPTAIGMALFSTAVMAAVASFTSSMRGVVAITQGIPIAALTGPVSAIALKLGGNPADPAVTATIVTAVALSTVVIGASALLLGSLRLGRFVRFVPFPVIGGFLAGSGWLILTGGIGVVAGHPVTLANLGEMLDPLALFRLLAAIAFLFLVPLVRMRLAVSIALPAAALAAIVLFNLVALVVGLDADALRADGWVIAVTGGASLWPPITPSDLGSVDWWAIASQIAELPTVVILTILAVLMNATGIELDTRRDVDLDQELRSVGFQNLVGGFGGGMPGFNSVSLTALANRLGSPNMLVGLIVSGLALAALIVGDIVLVLVPTPLLGGLLMWMGLALLIEWLVRSYARLSVWEYLVIILIFSVIVFVSFAWGIFVGLIAAVVLFVIEYGHVEIVRHVMTGKDYQSSNNTSEERREVLRSTGDAILIVRLQGFLFFGTADRLRKRIQQRIESHEGTPVRFLVVDFRRVSGLDSSTVLSFTRLAQLTSPDGFTLVLCGMSDVVDKALRRGGLNLGAGAHVRFESDLDHALEWCENGLLADVAPEVVGSTPVSAIDLLVDVVKDRRIAEEMLPHLERVEVAPGDRLIDQGTPSDDIYFVEQGRAAVVLDAGGDHDVRLATIARGSIVGEMAFYLGKPRSASVLAETPVVAWRLSAEKLDVLRQASPEIAIGFHRGMAGMLADRLTSTNLLVRLLAD